MMNECSLNLVGNFLPSGLRDYDTTKREVNDEKKKKDLLLEWHRLSIALKALVRNLRQ